MSPEDANLSTTRHLPSLSSPGFLDIGTQTWGALAKREDGRQMVYRFEWGQGWTTKARDIVLYDLSTPVTSTSFPLLYWSEPNMLEVSIVAAGSSMEHRVAGLFVQLRQDQVLTATQIHDSLLL